MAWAYSDIVGNTERGKLAEFIVAMALGITESISVAWNKYDLLSKEGIRIEVKILLISSLGINKAYQKLGLAISLPTAGIVSQII